MTATTIFTKPDCPYCAKAKALLDAEGIAYREIDVKASGRNADASIFFSGITTVPQIFIGSTHVAGSDELQRLHDAGRLVPLANGVREAIDVDGPSDEALAHGAEDWPMREVIPENDGTHSDDPEEWPILHMYKEFFGFWPNCFYYQRHWPVAYKLFVYCHNAPAIGMGKSIVGAPVMNAIGYATSNAHGCNYCQVHSASVGGEGAQGYANAIEAAREGDYDGEFGPFEGALAELAAASATNTVTADHLKTVTGHKGEARFSQAPIIADTAKINVTGTAMIASAFGFLNVFNDLTGVKIEREWAEASETEAGIGAGRHGISEDRDSSNLDHDLPEGGPSLEDMMAKYETIVNDAGGAEAYVERELGLMPDWMEKWPGKARPHHAYFYTELMGEREHARLPSELRHLIARVSHIAKGHDALAATEAHLAWIAGERGDRTVERARLCYDAAVGRNTPNGLFDERERAALRVAWLSAQTPLATIRRFVEPAVKAYTPVELVHLFTICGLASLIQRFSAITMPVAEPSTVAFMERHDLDPDSLALRYPLAPIPQRAAA